MGGLSKVKKGREHVGIAPRRIWTEHSCQIFKERDVTEANILLSKVVRNLLKKLKFVWA